MKLIAKIFRLAAGILALIPGAAGASYALPDVFPINMGFKTLLSTNGAVNHEFDTLANAGRYAVHHGSVSAMDQIKTNFPNVITIAMNPRAVDSENRSVGIDSGKTGNVWPGFWLYRAGCLLGSAISTTNTQIGVADATRFTTNDYALIYERDALGSPKFLTSDVGGTNGTYEFVNVTGVDTTNHILTVVRGRTGTTAKSFTAGQTAVAAFIPNWQINGKISQIKPNMSLVCPRHPVTGENWAEFAGRGRGAAIRDGLNDGTESDIVYCLAGDEADVDLDLQPDWGFKNGVNVYSLGWQEHVKIVREIAGPDKIIQHDCTRVSAGYRGWRYVNGAQFETFGDGNSFSQMFDLLSQWVEHAEVKPAFSYGYCRAPTTTYGGVLPDNDWMFRKQFAAGLMAGMPHPYGSGENMGLFDWDEQRGGNLDNYTWLGRALESTQRDLIGLSSTNLLAADTWNTVVSSNYAATVSGAVADTNGIEIAVTQIPENQDRDCDGVNLKLNRDFLLVAGREYTLIFDAKADDTAVYQGKSYPDMPVYIQISEHGTTTEKMGVWATRNWRTYRLSFVCAPNQHFRVEFGVAEAIGRVWLKNIKLHEGCVDRLSRDFENGKVFLNESETADWVVNLGTNKYWRLKGDIRPDINDGRKVSGSLTVPARDAVYLLKSRPAGGADYYDLTVTGGSGSGSYTNGESVNIVAEDRVDGTLFDRWTGDTQYVASVSSSTTTVTMSTQAVTVAASYKPIPDSVSDRWKTDASGNWNDSANWENGNVPGIPGGSNSLNTATFDITLTTNRTVTVDADRNISGIVFGNTSTNAYTLIGGTIKLSNGGVIQTLAGTGSHNETVASAIMIMGNGGSVTVRNGTAGNTAGLLITGTVSGNSTAGNVSTLYLDGANGTTSQNNTTAGISDGTAGGDLKVVKNGAGVWTLSFDSAVSTFTGGLDFNAGTIRFFGNRVGGFGGGAVIIGTNVTFNHANSTPTSVITNAMMVNGNFTMSGGANVEFRGAMDLGGAMRTVTQNANTNIVFSGVISNGGLIKAGADPLTLSGINVYGGGTTVSSGSLICIANGSMGTSNVTVAGGATLTLSATNCVGDTARLMLATNVTLNLNFTGTDIVSGISLDNGVSWLPFGSYTATQLDALGSGTYNGSGVLLVEGFADDPASTPYSWLAQYGLTNFNADAMDDADRDGLLTWQEYLAGTNPTNPASVFEITGSSVNAQGAVIRWASASNKLYNLSRTTNLMSAFSVLAGASNLPATPPENVFTNPVPNGTAAFYKISIQE
jgi:autotransporter-associated beta strand protein